MEAKIINSLKQYFEGVGPFSDLGVASVETDYSWEIPNKLFDGSTTNYQGSNFEANVALKQDLSRRWANEPENRKQITKWIISNWGGINGNKDNTLKQYCIQAQEDSPATPLKGIASFSKVLGVKDPIKYAIYDARVAVSLNAVQLLAKEQHGFAFPYLSGRNKYTGNWSPSTPRGFSTMKNVSIRTLTSEPFGWTRVVRDEAYQTYLEVLRQISTELRTPIYKLEMALFSQAVELACKVFPELRD